MNRSELPFWKKVLFWILYVYKKNKKRADKYLVSLLCLVLLLLFLIINNKYNIFNLWEIPNYLLLWYLIATTNLTRFLRLLNYCWDNILIDLKYVYKLGLGYLCNLYYNSPFIFFSILLIIILILAYCAYIKFKK